MHFKTVSLAAAAALAIGVPAAWAHHSHANYHPTEWTNLSGTVKEVQWMNPHVWLYIEVANQQGVKKTWALEGGSPAALLRGGWKPDTVKVGDNISVRCHALKDGSEGCLLGYLTHSNGSVKDKEFD